MVFYRIVFGKQKIFFKFTEPQPLKFYRHENQYIDNQRNIIFFAGGDPVCFFCLRKIGLGEKGGKSGKCCISKSKTDHKIIDRYRHDVGCTSIIKNKMPLT